MKKFLMLLVAILLPTLLVAQATSNAAPFTVTVPQKTPTITSLTPNTAPMNGAPVNMVVAGTNFDPAAKCFWGSIGLTTTFTSSTSLTCVVQTALLTVPSGQASAQYPVTVANPITVALTWTPSSTLTDGTPVAIPVLYNVRRDGTLLTSNPLSSPSYDDIGVRSGTHSWGVTAVDGVHAESVPATVSLTL